MAKKNNLRESRIRKLMTQKELARQSGVSQVTISFIENLISTPMDLTKQKLARALNCAPKDLFPDDDPHSRRKKVRSAV